MKKYILWFVAFVFVAVIFYVLFPKYYFTANSMIRCNTITGGCESRTNGAWHAVGN